MKNYYTIICCFMAVLCSLAEAPPEIHRSRIHSLEVLPDTNILLMGSTEHWYRNLEKEVWIKKYDAQGNIAGGVIYDSHLDFMREGIYNKHLSPAEDGGLFLMNRQIKSDDSTLFIIKKINERSKLLWSTTVYSGRFASHSLLVQKAGGALVLINSSSKGAGDSPGKKNMLSFHHLDAGGELVLQKNIDIGDLTVASLKKKADSTVVVVGKVPSRVRKKENSFDLLILTLSLKGDIINVDRHFFGDMSSHIGDVCFLPNGDILLSVNFGFKEGATKELGLFRLSRNGRIVWRKQYAEPKYDMCSYTLCALSNNRFMIVGSKVPREMKDDSTVYRTAWNRSKCWFETFDAEGNTLLKKIFKRQGLHFPNIAEQHDGSYVLTGLEEFSALRDKIWLLALSPMGELLWEKQITGELEWRLNSSEKCVPETPRWQTVSQ